MICTKCGIDKPIDDFYVKRDSKRKWVGRHKQCKTCVVARVKWGTKLNADARNAYMREYHQRIHRGETKNKGAQIIHALKCQPCKDCGGDFPTECMDFDHVRGQKLNNIGSMKLYSEEKIRVEVEKCDVICANCHRIRTRQRQLARSKDSVAVILADDV